METEEESRKPSRGVKAAQALPARQLLKTLAEDCVEGLRELATNGVEPSDEDVRAIIGRAEELQLITAQDKKHPDLMPGNRARALNYVHEKAKDTLLRVDVSTLRKRCEKQLSDVQKGIGILSEPFQVTLYEAQRLRLVHPEGMKKSALITEFTDASQKDPAVACKAESSIRHVFRQAERALNIMHNESGHNPRRSGQYDGTVVGYRPLFI